jgi:hypothetical protein
MKARIKFIPVVACLLASLGSYAQFQFSANPVWQVSGSYPTGLGWADFDHNGFPDVSISLGLDISNGPTLIYYNDSGTVSPAPGWASAYLAPGCGLYLNDFDKNGDIDIAVASLGLVSSGMAPVPNYLFMNNNGLPSTPSWFSAPGNAFSCAGGDVDGDGDIDLAFSRGDYATAKAERAALYLNSGGVFDSVPFWQSDSSYYGTDLAFADIDLDGDLDLALGARTKGVLVFFSHNNLPETSPSWSSHQVSGARQMAFGDVDNDGYPDLAVAAPGGKFYLFKNVNGVLDTVPSWVSVVGNEPSSVAWADADGDGDLDLAAGSWNTTIGIFANTNGVLSDTFTWSKSVGGGTQQISWIDYENDFLVDTIKILTGDGSRKVFYIGKQPIQKIISVETGGVPVPETGYCYDVTDGWLSFATAPATGEAVTVHYKYSGAPDLSLTTWSSARLYKNLRTLTGTPDHEMGTNRPAMDQNVPNPCHKATSIRFFLPEKDHIAMKLFNIHGAEVSVLQNKLLPAGDHTISIPVGHLSPGMYSIALFGTGYCLTRKIMVQ